LDFAWWEDTEIDHFLMEEKCLHLNILNAGYFRGADFDID
jgi:hypothetical protein